MTSKVNRQTYPHDDDRLSDVAALTLRKLAADRLTISKTGAGADIFPYFQTLVAARTYDGPEHTMARLAEAKVSPETVLDALIPNLSTLIGDKWLADEMSWSTVTIVSSRLQTLAWRYLEPIMLAATAARNAPKALMVVPEGETHTLGCVLAIGALTRAGFNATGLFGESDADVIRIAEDGAFDVIGVSTSGQGGKARLKPLLESLLSASKNADVLIGGPLLTCNAQLLDELLCDLRSLDSGSLSTILHKWLKEGRTTSLSGSRASVAGRSVA